jgi:hypothetical protein
MAEQARHPGRRPAADPAVIEQHSALIKEAVRHKEDCERQLNAAYTEIAKRCNDAMQDGVQTNFIAEELLGVTRQAVYKLVSERVDGKPSRNTPAARPLHRKRNGTAPKIGAPKVPRLAPPSGS